MQSLDIFKNWEEGNEPTACELTFLLKEELANKNQAQAFDITPENGREAIKNRARLFQNVKKEVIQLCHDLGLTASEEVLSILWRLWLPLAIQLDWEKKTLKRPLIQGILGGQGTGKTTLASVIRLILGHLGHRTIAISIDDLYKTYAERQELRKSDRRLLWRGPPGTHDVELGIQVLDQLRQPKTNQPIPIPRFDKSLEEGEGDRIEPEMIEAVDIILFEGWFVGTYPVDESKFENPPSPILTEVDQQFARDINQELKSYLPLWERLDRLLVLYPTDYHFSKQWRKEAEHKMIAQRGAGMTDAEIDEFVNYFWRSLHPELFIAPLIQNPDLVDLVIEINADHRIGKIYTPF